MNLKVKKLHPEAILPRRAHERDSGLDLYVLEDTAFSEPFEYKLIHTGIAIELPEGYEGQIRPRSSLIKKGFLVPLGTIDTDYKGEILIQTIAYRLKPHTVEVIKAGERIAQLIVAKIDLFDVEEVYELMKTERGENGFGSTGR